MKIYPLLDRDEMMYFKGLISDVRLLEPSIYNLGAIDEFDNRPVGVLICKKHYFEYQILYLYVVPEYRRTGIGTELVSMLLENLIDLNIIGKVKAIYEFADDNYDINAFFKSLPYINTYFSGSIYKITERDRLRSPYMENLTGLPSDRVVPFEELTGQIRHEFIHMIEKIGYDRLEEYIGRKLEYEEELCLTYYNGSIVEAAIFVLKEGEKLLNIDFEFSANTGKGFAAVLGEFLRKLEERGKGWDFRMQPISKSEENLILEIFPSVESVTRIMTAEWNMQEP